jgi:multidrug efflux pump subunit AcrB
VAVVGALGLVGMMLKNGIVLVDDVEKPEDMEKIYAGK